MSLLTASGYPVFLYSPAQYVPVGSFQHQWAASKVDAMERATDPYGRNPEGSTLSAALNAYSPSILLASVLIFSLSGASIRGVNPEASLGHYFSNFPILFSLTFFTISLTFIIKNIRFNLSLKKSSDFAILESARIYLKRRYGFLPKNWEERFISYLLGEEVKVNRFSEEPELVVRRYQGVDVFMIANVNGEFLPTLEEK